ncbi:glycosyltransferase [Candidatus Microgenomates bacterium]|nr:MAG: glycosyltransferase [Candidatus Microgenomates bacterium]
MRIGIFYDNLLTIGGAEKHVLQLADALCAEIITSGHTDDVRKWISPKTKINNLGNLIFRVNKPLGILFETPFRFLINKNRFNYDVNIFIGFSSIFASSKNKKNIYYNLIPHRLFYDKDSIKLKKFNLLQIIILKLYVITFKKWSENLIANNFDKIITQSKTAQVKIKSTYRKSAIIIPPPIDIKKYIFKTFGDFYLTVGRLYPEKRLELLVDAFKKLPNKKLIIVGSGPLKQKLINRIGLADNIQLLSNLSEKKLQQLYSNCLATIYMPKDEDFGLVPLEGMAAGKACIAANEGGCKETVIDGKTGFLINATEKDIIKAIKKLDLKEAKKMKNNCLRWVKKFDTKECIKQWKKELNIFKTV